MRTLRMLTHTRIQRPKQAGWDQDSIRWDTVMMCLILIERGISGLEKTSGGGENDWVGAARVGGVLLIVMLRYRLVSLAAFGL
jgi:hypothetical protein